MADFESLLTRWLAAGVLDAEAAHRIRAYEQKQAHPAGLRWQGLVALILGALLLGCGVVLFVSAHWDQLGPAARFALVIAMVAVFHIAGAWARESFHGMSTALHAVGTIATGAAIALTGQIFNIQEHWPAAILMWAVAAAAGWALLHDQAQEIFTLLLAPAWVISEFTYYADGHIGESVYIGRFLFVWAVLYATFFLGSKRKTVQGILFAAGAIACELVGTISQLEGWRSWTSFADLSAAFTACVWGFGSPSPPAAADCASLALRNSLTPVAAAMRLATALPLVLQRLQTRALRLRQRAQLANSDIWTEPEGCLRMRWCAGLCGLCDLVGRANGFARPWSTWGWSGLPLPSAGSTSATSSTKLAGRWG